MPYKATVDRSIDQTIKPRKHPPMVLPMKPLKRPPRALYGYSDIWLFERLAWGAESGYTADTSGPTSGRPKRLSTTPRCIYLYTHPRPTERV